MCIHRHMCTWVYMCTCVDVRSQVCIPTQSDLKIVAAWWTQGHKYCHHLECLLSSFGMSLTQEKIKSFYILKPQCFRPVAWRHVQPPNWYNSSITLRRWRLITNKKYISLKLFLPFLSTDLIKQTQFLNCIPPYFLFILNKGIFWGILAKMERKFSTPVDAESTYLTTLLSMAKQKVNETKDMLLVE